MHKIGKKLNLLIFFLNFDLFKGGGFSLISPPGCALGLTQKRDPKILTV